MFLASVLSLTGKPQAFIRWLRPATAAGLVCCASFFAVGVAHASAAQVNEVNQLLEQGKTAEAARRVQSYLKQNSNDLPMRFLQGVVAAEQKKYDQAIKIFVTLTQEYPSLPEPYNNLAALYVAKGDDRKASLVLEQAMRTNPSYATAHENLANLYTRMASDAYAKALQLDSNRNTEHPKLAIIKQIFPGQIVAAGTAPAAATTPAAAKAEIPVTASAAPVTPQPAPAAAPKAPEVKPAIATPTASAVSAEKPEPTAMDAQAAAAVEKAVLAWAQAWEQQNMADYYAAYSSSFDPQGSSLAAWKTDRKNRIVGKPAITVEVRDLKVTVQGARASASFRQHYASGGYKATTRKTLRMQYEGEKWRITREETGR